METFRTCVLLACLFLCHFLPTATAARVVSWQLPGMLEFQAANMRSNREYFRSWVPHRDCLDWEGVTCENGQVVDISLSGLVPYGTLTPGLGTITSLKYLDLRLNYLYGTIPKSFGNLTNLVSLKLTSNRLTGEIPPELSNLINIEYLDLSGNNFRGALVPNFAARFTKLKYMFLSENRLSGSIPISIGNATLLQELHLAYNYFSGTIPSSIGRLTLLQNLYLHYNSLSGSIPESFGNLTSLVNLGLNNNLLDGSLPSSFGNFPDLTTLNLDNNFLSGNLPEGIGKLTSLNSLSIEYPNNLTGSIPNSIGNLVNLYTLSFNGMSLTGSIPSTIGALQNLNTLNLGGNKLSGSIPRGIGNLTSLQYLYLNSNNLSGPIPDIIGRLSSLHRLELQENKLSGTISNIMFCTNLQYLYLNNNFFSGNIPTSINKLSQLQALELEENELSGSIPTTMGDLQYLGTLDLSYNNISGAIPTSFSKLQIRSLYLESNQIVSPIPMSSLKLVNYLWLSNNKLTGTLPSLSKNFFYVLDLSFNELSGSLPDSISWCCGNKFFFNNNKFSGEFKTNLFSYRQQTLDLSFNKFTSFRKTILGQVSRALYLNDNELVGTLPYFDSTPSVLWFQNNFLTGPILLLTYGSATSLNMSNNYLNGTILLNNYYDNPQRYCREGAFSNNCLFNEDVYCPLDKQRNVSECLGFCDTTQIDGACSNKGTCVRTKIYNTNSNSTSNFTCECNYGYNNFITSSKCVAVGSKGRGLSPPTIKNPKFQNRWFRYGSFGYTNFSKGWFIPQKWNWTLSGGGRVGDQRTCGASWAFAPILNIESTIFLASGGLSSPSLSTQQILNCQGTSSPCNGGFPGDTLEYSANRSISLESTFPYTGNAKSCPLSAGSSGFNISSYERAQPFGILALLLATTQGPVGVMIEASRDSFVDYKGGYIYDDPSCFSRGVDHTVIVVGFDLTTSPPHLLIKNSWGINWGERGFMRISIRGGFGTCGIFSTAGFVPIVQGTDPCQSGSFGATKIPNNIFGAGKLNPCGAGNCSVIGRNNICACPPDFVAVTNSDGSQTCAPAFPCTFFPSNPCGVGVCVNVDSSPGVYTCLCSPGYVLSANAVYGTATCLSSSTVGTPQTFTVPNGPTVTCDLVADVFGLSSDIFKMQQLPGVNCPGPLPQGTSVNVRGAKSCALPYIISQNDTCPSISSLFLLAPGTNLGGPNSPNLNLNCSTTLQAGKQICIRTGTPLESPLCNSTYIIPSGATCLNVINSTFGGNAATFFSLNPTLNCGRLFLPTGNAVLPGPEVCTSKTTFETIKRGCTGTSKTVYTVGANDNCLSILTTFYRRSQSQFKQMNSGWVCDDNKLVVGATICRSV